MKQEITLNINCTTDDGKSYSTTAIAASSLDELQRMLSLAGVKSDIQPTSGVEVTSNPSDPLNQLPIIPSPEDISSDEPVDFATAVEAEGDLPGDTFDMGEFDRLAMEMEDCITATEDALNEMDFDYGHNHKNDKENYDEYSHKAQSRSGRGNIPVRQINSYGDNPWSMDLNEAKIENLAILAEETENADFKSAMKKVIGREYHLSESEVISLANIFINLLNDKTPKRFTTMQNMVKAISESMEMYKQYKAKD